MGEVPVAFRCGCGGPVARRVAARPKRLAPGAVHSPGSDCRVLGPAPPCPNASPLGPGARGPLASSGVRAPQWSGRPPRRLAGRPAAQRAARRIGAGRRERAPRQAMGTEPMASARVVDILSNVSWLINMSLPDVTSVGTRRVDGSRGGEKSRPSRVLGVRACRGFG